VKVIGSNVHYFVQRGRGYEENRQEMYGQAEEVKGAGSQDTDRPKGAEEHALNEQTGRME
jgi:hypothetical protein